MPLTGPHHAPSLVRGTAPRTQPGPGNCSTHPAWSGELKDNLVRPGHELFRVEPDIENPLGTPVRRATASPFASCSPPRSPPSTVAPHTRKVHHLLSAVTFTAGPYLRHARTDGKSRGRRRAILRFDPRDLLEIVGSDPGSYLDTRLSLWFAVLGSKSGFDTVAECYADLAAHVFVSQTRLASDPLMNWMCSALDSYRLVSNSDTDPQPMLGVRQPCYRPDVDYSSSGAAPETVDGPVSTVEFFPVRQVSAGRAPQV
jgi:ATP-dependent DNA helicase UvrD/PcrA